MPHPGEDDLALLALGEHVPGVQEHVEGCEHCAAELLALTATVRTARDAGPAALAPPPPQVWDRIAGELDMPSVLSPRTRRLRVPVLLGAAAAVVVAAVLVVRPGGGAPTSPLTALGAVRASGEAVLRDGSAGRTLEVDTSGLGPPDGFYEVWLLDPARARTLALGTLDAGGRAVLPVPAGVDLHDYPLVDVSVEPDDGNPAHSSDSVLRGPLRT